MKKQCDIKRCFYLLLPVLLLTSIGPVLLAQDQDPPNRGFASIKQILDRSCSACHDWTASYEKIVGGGHVVPKEPEKSTLYQMIATESMPMSGPKLTAEEKALIRAWIVAGAPETDTPIVVAPSKAAAPPASHIRSIKVPAHIASGFASTALFTAAGVIGVMHFAEMKSVVHPGGFFSGDESGGDPGDNNAQIIQIWNNQQAGRWAHVGLVASGEALYLFNTITGLTMLTKAKIHRFSFFLHGTLMLAQIVLGFLETDAFSRGAHDELLAYLGTHAVIGVTIPAIMLFAGIENIIPTRAPRRAAWPAGAP
jgi:mono/diheme cytochrome c family protein